MKFAVSVAGLAARIAAARVERMRSEAVPAALAELARRTSRQEAGPESSTPDAATESMQQRS